MGPVFTGPCLRTLVHEGLGYRGLRGERIFPDRIQGDAVSSACVVYGPGQDHVCRRWRDFKVSRHSTLARGAAQATETQRVRTGQKGGFSRHAEIFSGTTSSIAVAHAINTNADEPGPPAPVVPPLVSGRLFLGGLLLSRARLRFARLPL